MAENSWDTYFPFATGTPLYFDGPLIFNGDGRVETNDKDQLVLSFRFPAIPLFKIPATEGVITLNYKQEGRGNSGVAVVNGQTITDNDVSIRSSSGNTTRIIDPSLSAMDGKDVVLTLVKVNDRKARLTVMPYGKSFDITQA